MTPCSTRLLQMAQFNQTIRLISTFVVSSKHCAVQCLVLKLLLYFSLYRYSTVQDVGTTNCNTVPSQDHMSCNPSHHASQCIIITSTVLVLSHPSLFKHEELHQNRRVERYRTERAEQPRCCVLQLLQCRAPAQYRRTVRYIRRHSERKHV